MTGANDLASMVPGFDFLKGLLKNAGAGLPSMGQWIAPTLNPEDLEKRIQELKTVHFWLDQNAKLLATTIQALEVQRMTLSALKTMNLPLAELSEALKIKVPTSTPTSRSAEADVGDDDEADDEQVDPPPSTRSNAAAKPAPLAVDPLQWWGALTQQFTEIASQAVKDSAADSAKSLAGAKVRGPAKTAARPLKKGASAPAKVAAAAAPARRKR